MIRKAHRFKNGSWSDCRIDMVNVVGHGTMSLGGGTNNMVYGYERGDCLVPLFNDAERKDGICRSCKAAGAVPRKVYRFTQDGPVEIDEAEVARLLAIPKWTKAEGGLDKEFK